jgi:hypothetical protein
MRFAPVLICLAALCGAVEAAAQKPKTAQAWLAVVSPLPATAKAAYSQWIDVGSTLKPGPTAEKVTDGIKAEVMTLARPVQAAGGTGRPLSAKDQALVDKIFVFPGNSGAQQKIQAARAAQAALEQKWHAELNALEQRRLLERSALPACRNEAGAPSQSAIRDVEQAYAQAKIAIADRYLAQSQPLVEQVLAAVAARIQHGDAVMAAWTQLRNPGMRAQLAPLAGGAESNALLDVELVQSYIQDISKLAARPVADRRALDRVYALAKGC